MVTIEIERKKKYKKLLVIIIFFFEATISVNLLNAFHYKQE